MCIRDSAGAFRRDVLRPVGALLGAAQRSRERNVAAAALVQRLGVARLAGGDGVGQRLAHAAPGGGCAAPRLERLVGQAPAGPRAAAGPGP